MRGGKDQQTRHQPGDVDPQLVDRLEALASTNRLRLLSLLEDPRAVAEIELSASPQQPDTSGPMTRQGVRHHIGKLRKASLVETRTSTEKGRRVHEYVTDRRGLYELAEALRRKAAGGPPSPQPEMPPRWDTDPASTPSVRVLHGAEIGRSFALPAEKRDAERGWIIGRGERVDVSLGWDPDVERQAGEIEPHGNGFRLIDLRATQNRLSLEGEPMDPGEVRDLADRDVIGVGSSLLRLET